MLINNKNNISNNIDSLRENKLGHYQIFKSYKLKQFFKINQQKTWSKNNDLSSRNLSAVYNAKLCQLW